MKQPLFLLILNQDYSYGQWQVSFDASNYPSGVYFYKLTAGNYTATNKNDTGEAKDIKM